MAEYDYAMPDEERKRAAWMALAQASAGLLGAPRGREFQALGQGVQQGLLSYGDAQSQWQRSQQERIKMQMAQEAFAAQQEERQMKLAEAKRLQEQQQVDQRALGGFFGGGPQLQNMGPGGPTPANAAAVAPPSRGQQYRMAADYYAQRGNAEMAKKYNEQADKWDEEYSTTPQVTLQNNVPVLAQFGKRGGIKVAEGFAPPPDTQVLNLGNRHTVIDKRTTPVGTSFDVGVGPDTVYSGNITMRGQNMTDARARESTAAAAGGKANELVATVRKEFNSLDEVKNFKAVVPMLESARKAPDTPAGDLDLIYAVGKVLDPGSVVREGELSLVIKSGTPMEQFNGYVRAIGAGKGRLPPAQRAKLVAMLEGRVGELASGYQRSKALYERQARAAGLPTEQIFAEVPDAAPAPAAPAAATLSPQEQAELDALRKRFGRK